jgi:hypothetical protein
MHELIDRLLSYGERSDAGTLFRFEGGARFFLADADAAALRSKQEPAGEPVTIVSRERPPLRLDPEDVAILDQAWREGSPVITAPPAPAGKVKGLERPITPLSTLSNDLPAWQQVEELFNRHRAPTPPWRLRDELVTILSWALYGVALEPSASSETVRWRTTCASDGCENQAAVHFVRGDVGSRYCHACYVKVQALPASPDKEGVSND